MPSESPLTWLAAGQPNQPFPPARTALAHPNGLLAAGGDLHPRRVLAAYRQGIFPWFGEGEPVLWWSPHPRAVVPVGQLHRSRSLQRAWRRADFAVSSNQAFTKVLEHCARIGRGDGVWLTADMRDAYAELHQLGHAHSVEIWRAGMLIGGIYGLRLGRVFFGESMFSHATNGSKLALIALEECLRAQGVQLLDGQVASPHLLRMGFQLWPRDAFLNALDALVDISSPPAPWQLAAGLPAGTEHRS
ncbi:MAG: leucyl/phenylalanyl-tRNA--protein transferase [Oceanococcaceae bacterium]